LRRSLVDQLLKGLNCCIDGLELWWRQISESSGEPGRSPRLDRTQDTVALGGDAQTDAAAVLVGRLTLEKARLLEGGFFNQS
jgi:hypothetical protein